MALRVASENYSDTILRKMVETRFRSLEASSLLLTALVFVLSIHFSLLSHVAAVSAQGMLLYYGM